MPYHIIVADDDNNVRSVLARIIQHIYADATVSAVADGGAAIAVYNQCGADLVVTNHVMSPMDGVTLIRMVRAQNTMVPIIATSSTPSARPEMLTAGATVFLTKIDAVNQLETLLPTLLPV
jgi:CheY-like chemotaxis protein